jgi:hypothetical protein
MLTETTVSKLREMRLSVMANALKDQLADPQFQNMAFEDRIGSWWMLNGTPGRITT